MGTFTDDSATVESAEDGSGSSAEDGSGAHGEASGGSAGADVVSSSDGEGGGSTGTSAAERGGVPSKTPGNRPRSAVGVVYEPDESPDGFPLEFGNIIVGLPKQPETSGASADADDTGDGQTGDAQVTVQADEPAGADATAAGDATVAGDAESVHDAAPVAADEPADDVAANTEDDVAADSADDAADESAAGTVDQPQDDAADTDPAAADDTSGESATDSANDGTSNAADEADVVGSAAEDAPADEAAGTDAADENPAAAAGAAAADAADDAGAEAAGESAAEVTADASGDDTGAPAGGDDAGAAEADAAGAVGNDSSGGDEGDAAGAGADEPAGAGAAAGGENPGAAEAGAAGEEVAAAGAAGNDSGGGDEGDAAGADEAADGTGAEAAGESAAEETADASVGDARADAGGDNPGAAAADDEAEEELTAEQLAERLAAEQAAMALITALMKLRGVLAGSQLSLEVVGADEARQQQKAMLDQLDDYLLPRLVQLEAPILAVVGGSTGAGKSTLVNTVIGKVVSEPGVLRPTTRSPVLIHHPADADWFVGDRVLPGMARTSSDEPGGMEDAGQLRLVAADSVPRGLAILDAPDIDSVVEANRDLATQLLAAADLWLFVTTAARYSDAVPWEFLQSASDRSTAVAVVLDRAPSETIDDITGHLAQMLLERGLGESPLFSIQETVVDGNGMLPQQSVASIKDWLVDLAADAEARASVVRRTLQGAVSAMVKKTPPFAAAVRAQAETAVELRTSVESAYDQGVKDIAKACQDGTLLRGEVLARWQEFVGTGELLKGLQSNAGRLRDRLKSSLGNKPAETRDVSDAIQSGLESLLREHGAAAAERAEKVWEATAPGRQLLAAAEADRAANGAEGNGGRSLGAMSEEFPAAASRTVREWQTFVLDLVRSEGADKKSTARILEYGVNGLGLSLMVVVFASGTGIPKGAQASAGAGSAVVGKRLLEAVFGDKAVQGMVDRAREDLDGKVHALMDAEFARYLAVLDQHPVDAETARQLTEAARAVEDCT
ncbi:AAA family ATPase [Kribbella soli]|uniref:AAA family ATPase n=1 Tax=Kribbella soli TaxID=1124743 RepID=UPI001EDDFFCD|nr:AAA family ATPase [Kribbella soli]